MSDEDDDNVLDGRRYFGQRYLEPQELVDYVKALRPDLSWLHVDVCSATI